MYVSDEERQWAHNLVFDEQAMNWAISNIENHYAHYFPPQEKKLNDKIAILKFLKLKERSNLKILDMSAGAGHFSVLARSLGHTVSSTETVDTINSLKELHQFYKLDPIPLFVEANKEFTLPESYDVITTARTVFDIGWTVNEWKFFKENLFDYLNSQGEFFIKTNIKGLPGYGDFLESVFGKNLIGWNSISFHVVKK